MNLNGTEYFYVRNAQSDIIGLVDKDGSTAASYVYDTWGKLVSIKDGSGNDVTNVATSVGYKNPYRYRGYRYDTETGLYYCNSRYYNPEWGRFINADSVVGKPGELLSHNVFAYCGNDPVNMSDPSGYWFDTALDVGFISYDVVELANNPSDGWAWASLGADAVCAVLPGLTGGRLAVKAIENSVIGLDRIGSALKVDIIKAVRDKNNKIIKEFPSTAVAHGFSDLVDNYAGYATHFKTHDEADLYQILGANNGVSGRFEWLVENGSVTHRMFIENGTINGVTTIP